MLKIKQEVFNAPVEYTLSVQEEGLYSLNIQAESHSDWEQIKKESNLLEIEVETEDHKVFKYSLVTFMGKELYYYKVFLGFLVSGSYKITIQNKEVDVCERTMVVIHDLVLDSLQLAPLETLAHQHAPLLFGRNHFSAFDNCFTDTPLALSYLVNDLDNGIIEIEYHYIFSHEDEGTPAQLLMAKWGRTLDIEYCYRVKWDCNKSEIIEAWYQGPEHENRIFTGQYVGNSHRPILQTRTTNGNFDHVIDSTYCFSIAPEIFWNTQTEPREWFMTTRPDINVVMIKEAERQLTQRSEPMNQIVSPTHFLFAFCFTSKEERNGIIDFVYPFQDKIVSSSHDFYHSEFNYGSYTDTFPNFTIAFEYDDIRSCLSQMSVRLLDGKKINIHKIEFYTLHSNGMLHLVYQTERPIILTKQHALMPIGVGSYE